MAELLYNLIDKSKIIPVDKYDTDDYKISDENRIFKNLRGEIILPIHDLFINHRNTSLDMEQLKQLDYFAMHTKRSYNSDETREHICRYLNYFEQFYDTDKELLLVLYKIKIAMDYIRTYSEDNFINDVNKYLIRNKEISFKIRHMVDDNYSTNLSNNNNKTPNLQFNNKHAKILYEITILMNMYIPLATHFMYINNIRTKEDIQRFMLRLFDICILKYEDEQGVYIFDKLYETALSVTNKSINVDKILWDKNLIRSTNPTTHVRDSVIDAIIQIMVKMRFDKPIISFLYFSNRKYLRYRIIELKYEFSFSKLSESKRDSDFRSELDRYESHLNKKDEAIAMQNKVSAEQTTNFIVNKFGPISEDELEFYRRKLISNGRPLINNTQLILIGYSFFKYFNDPMNFMAIRNNTDYIKLIICAKKMLLNLGMRLLPYIMSSKIIGAPTRKSINKKDIMKYERSKLYEAIKNKYNSDERILQKIWELIGTVISSNYEIIDYDNINHCAGPYDKQTVPIKNDILYEELLSFIVSI